MIPLWICKKDEVVQSTIHLEYFSIQSMRDGRKRVVLQILVPIEWSEKNLISVMSSSSQKRTERPEVPLGMEDETGLLLYHLTDYSLPKVIVNLTNSHVSLRE